MLNISIDLNYIESPATNIRLSLDCIRYNSFMIKHYRYTMLLKLQVDYKLIILVIIVILNRVFDDAHFDNFATDNV